jgi:diaminohydroxyphosphoribosylaminopyrimidine deaminase/5-amino-6-(5-phosphoribosylamino)uracil reductase
MVGVGTVLKDDPRLTVRLARGPDPVRVVLDSGLRIPLKAKVFDNLGRGDKGSRLIIFTTGRAPRAKIKKVLETGAEVKVLPATKNGLGIKRALKVLGNMGISTLLIEGGSSLAASALGRGAVDKLAIFFSPMILGRDALASVGELSIKGLSRAPRIKGMTVRRIGDDLLVEGYL